VNDKLEQKKHINGPIGESKGKEYMSVEGSDDAGSDESAERKKSKKKKKKKFVPENYKFRKNEYNT